MHAIPWSAYSDHHSWVLCAAVSAEDAVQLLALLIPDFPTDMVRTAARLTRPVRILSGACGKG